MIFKYTYIHMYNIYVSRYRINFPCQKKDLIWLGSLEYVTFQHENVFIIFYYYTYICIWGPLSMCVHKKTFQKKYDPIILPSEEKPNAFWLNKYHVKIYTLTCVYFIFGKSRGRFSNKTYRDALSKSLLWKLHNTYIRNNLGNGHKMSLCVSEKFSNSQVVRKTW